MDFAELCRHIAEAATSSDDGDGLLAELCPLMVEAGLPIWRLSVSMPTLDTVMSSFSVAWTSDRGIAKYLTSHGEDDETAFRRSPIRALLDQDLEFGRWRIEAPGSDAAYPVLRDLKEEGGTDYILHLVPFTPGTALRGVALSFATRQPGGFADHHLAAIAQLVPVLGLTMAKCALAYTLRRTLSTYLGAATGEQVLGGRILRGEGRTIWAAILLVDLRNFTALTDRSDPKDVVAWLDEHFEALGNPVLEHGGEILKFLGDGFLAVFPVTAPEASPCEDCEKAFAAALAAQEANRALNRRRNTQGLPALEADLVLHFGEVVYGNVGTRQRLDFTVIGRAVNEASRIEKCCGMLDRSLLLSESFAGRCRHMAVPVGTVPLRGLEQPHRVWALPDESADRDRVAVETL